MPSSNTKTALVTGASSGMGKEIAKRLLRDGYRVYVAARQVDKMRDLEALGAQPLKMDITVESEVEAAVARIIAERGGVDVLVNNAGFGLYGPMEEIGMDEARYQFEVNVFGPARLTQLLLPAMRAKGAGRIVVISSMGGKIYTPLGSWYHATKHALEGWSDCLRLELAPHGIDVIVIEPGIIETGFGDVVAQGLVKRSGTGPYAKLTNAVATATSASYGHNRASSPTLIGDVAGKFAGSLIAMRSWLGDRAFDRIIMSQIG